MKKLGLLLLVALGICGCTTLPPSIPADYWGPQARVKDSFAGRSDFAADFFYLDKINGQKIADSREATKQLSHEHRSPIPYVPIRILPTAIERAVPARLSTFQIVGQIYYMPAVDRLLATVYEVKGEVEFAPLPNHGYTVKGHIFDNGDDYDNYLAVWMEDDQTGEVVGQKFVLEGAKSLNVFQKLSD